MSISACPSCHSVLRQRLRYQISFLESCRRSFRTSPRSSKWTDGSESLYWDTTAPSPEQLQSANRFFETHPPRKLWTATEWRKQNTKLTSALTPEVAFIGRSNVGKSSLLNALLLSPALNHVGPRPGKTSTMHAWGLAASNPVTGGAVRGRNGEMDVKVAVLDMPGYGHASHDDWGSEILKYFKRRKQLRRVFVLVDALHGVKSSDSQMLDLLQTQGISHQVIASKSDRLERPEDLEKSLEKIKQTIDNGSNNGLKALGELLIVGSLGDGRKNDKVSKKSMTGLNDVRWAVLVAAGLEGWARKKQSPQTALEDDFLKMLYRLSAQNRTQPDEAEDEAGAMQESIQAEEREALGTGRDEPQDPSVPPFVPLTCPPPPEATEKSLMAQSLPDSEWEPLVNFPPLSPRHQLLARRPRVEHPLLILRSAPIPPRTGAGSDHGMDRGTSNDSTSLLNSLDRSFRDAIQRNAPASQSTSPAAKKSSSPAASKSSSRAANRSPIPAAIRSPSPAANKPLSPRASPSTSSSAGPGKVVRGLEAFEEMFAPSPQAGKTRRGSSKARPKKAEAKSAKNAGRGSAAERSSPSVVMMGKGVGGMAELEAMVNAASSEGGRGRGRGRERKRRKARN